MGQKWYKSIDFKAISVTQYQKKKRLCSNQCLSRDDIFSSSIQTDSILQIKSFIVLPNYISNTQYCILHIPGNETSGNRRKEFLRDTRKDAHVHVGGKLALNLPPLWITPSAKTHFSIKTMKPAWDTVAAVSLEKTTAWRRMLLSGRQVLALLTKSYFA